MTITVGELIKELEQYDNHTEVIKSDDTGEEILKVRQMKDYNGEWILIIE